MWPTSPSGVVYMGTTSTQAWSNAAAAGWPALDYSTSRLAAGVTDAAGQATFNVTVLVLAGGVEFNTEEPTHWRAQLGRWAGVAGEPDLGVG